MLSAVIAGPGLAQNATGMPATVVVAEEVAEPIPVPAEEPRGGSGPGSAVGAGAAFAIVALFLILLSSAAFMPSTSP